MSSTEMYIARADGEFNLEETFRNSWRGAAFVWRVLWDKYGEKKHEYDHFLEGANLTSLFKVHDAKMTEDEKIVLMSTADRVFIAGNNFLQLADAFDRFAELHPVEPDHYPCSFPEQAILLRQLHGEVPKPRGVAWNQTTVNQNPWSLPVPCGECGCTCNAEWRPYSLDEDDDHWELFEEYEKSKEKP